MAVIDKIKKFFSVANKNKILENEIAYSVPNSNRSVWGDFSLLQNLSPTVLTSILNDIKCGYIPKEYLEIASDIELKDTHYRSVLNTRKLAVTSLDIKVIATSDDEKNLEIAKAVERDIVKNETAEILILLKYCRQFRTNTLQISKKAMLQSITKKYRLFYMKIK